MSADPRASSARFYDMDPDPLQDVPFYAARIGTARPRVLELGCGTGRVTVPLAAYCGSLHGIELSQAMLSICQAKLRDERVPASKVVVELGDITSFDLGRTFDLIIAPFRVLQNLETDDEVTGMMRCIRRHLAPGGTCILNVFNIRQPTPEALVRDWSKADEVLDWEVTSGIQTITCHVRMGQVDPGKLVLYPKLIFRVREGNRLVDEVVFNLVMRCYYPAMLEGLITDHGFEVIGRWGGYAGEAYGRGRELVVQFRDAGG